MLVEARQLESSPFDRLRANGCFEGERALGVGAAAAADAELGGDAGQKTRLEAGKILCLRDGRGEKFLTRCMLMPRRFCSHR